MGEEKEDTVNKPSEKWLDLWRVRLNTAPVQDSTTDFAPVQKVSDVVVPLLASSSSTTIYSHDMDLR
jgi:hypothetical protein